MKIGPGTIHYFSIFSIPFSTLFLSPKLFSLQSSSSTRKKLSHPLNGHYPLLDWKTKIRIRYTYTFCFIQVSTQRSSPSSAFPLRGKVDPLKGSHSRQLCELRSINRLISAFFFWVEVGNGSVSQKKSLTSFANLEVFDDVECLRPLPYGSPSFYLKVILEAIPSTFFGNFNFLEFFLRFFGK